MVEVLTRPAATNPRTPQPYTSSGSTDRTDSPTPPADSDVAEAAAWLREFATDVCRAAEKFLSQLLPQPLVNRQGQYSVGHRVIEHYQFLRRSATGAGSITTPQMADLAWKAWLKLWGAAGAGLPIPCACVGLDGQILYTWDRGEHHLELEILPDGPAEFFYRNRRTGELWDAEYTVGEPIDSTAATKLKLFI